MCGERPALASDLHPEFEWIASFAGMAGDDVAAGRRPHWPASTSLLPPRLCSNRTRRISIACDNALHMS